MEQSEREVKFSTGVSEERRRAFLVSFKTRMNMFLQSRRPAARTARSCQRSRLPGQDPNDVPERGRQIVDDADDDVVDVWRVANEAFDAVDKDIDVLDRPVPDLEDGDARWQLPLAHAHDP